MIEENEKLKLQPHKEASLSHNSSQTYNELCTEYYDIGQLPSEGAIDFYLHYAQQAKGRIFEPMCGTGLFLLPIKEAGFDIEGLDASVFMINALKKKCSEKGLSLPLVSHGLLQELNRSQIYHLVIIPTGSINLISEDLFKACLQQIYKSLAKDSLFVFEACTPHWEKGINLNRYYVEAYPRPENRKLVASFSYSKPADNLVEVVCRYEMVQDNNLVKTELEVATLRLYRKEEIYALLKEIGFSDIKAIKRYDLNESPDPDDKVVVYECKK